MPSTKIRTWTTHFYGSPSLHILSKIPWRKFLVKLHQALRPLLANPLWSPSPLLKHLPHLVTSRRLRQKAALRRTQRWKNSVITTFKCPRKNVVFLTKLPNPLAYHKSNLPCLNCPLSSKTQRKTLISFLGDSLTLKWSRPFAIYWNNAYQGLTQKLLPTRS